MRLVMIDNYDSFTYNLVQLFYEFRIQVLVFRNDEITIAGIRRLAPDWICISPGPRDPAHAGISKSVIAELGQTIPILGVCLGMQAMNEVFGGKTRKAPLPVHGKTCMVHHSGRSLFANIPTPFRVARYHSLCIEPGSEDIVPLATADDGVLMGIKHRSWPVFGIQFHPESFMSQYGIELVHNFLQIQQWWQAPELTMYGIDRFPRAVCQSGGQYP
ncbi:MAG: aminodeoxychorismate/anthranilate synthase component II [Syntrophobacteraceae bacterium]